MKNVLITGVAGLLGSHYSKHLLNRGYKVIGIDDLSGGYRDFIDDRVNFYQFDLKNQNKVNEVFSNNRIDVVYHFAAYAAEGLSPFIRNFNYSNNILSSVNLINASITNSVEKFIFTSSMAVYGRANPPFSETTPLAPDDPYGVAKMCVEQDLLLANNQFGLDYNIVRPHNVIGVNQNIWDRYRNVIGIWIRKVLSGSSITVYGDGLQTRAFSDIQYYMDPFEKLIDLGGGEVFNIGADQYFKIIDVANLCQKVGNKYGFYSDIVHLEPRHEVKHAFCDHSKAKKLLNFEDKTDIEKTIDEMFVWAMNQPNREVKNMEYEVNKGIYKFWK